MNTLAKGAARIVLLMGLEPVLVSGVSAISLADDGDIPLHGSCKTEPNVATMEQSTGMWWMFTLVFILCLLGLLIF